MKLQDEILDIIVEIAEVEKEGFDPDASFIDDMGLDSLRALEILAAIENKYSITINPERLREMTTLNNVVKIANEYYNAN